MFTFTVSRQVKLDNGNDDWILIDGTPVFPLGVGELLDERLNEAYITIVNSKTPVFRPCTEIMVTVKDGEAIKERYYFIVARDDASEMPIGSGLYKHDLYMIERTKLLEGVLGQTVTFTNTGEGSVKDAETILPAVTNLPVDSSLIDFSVLGIKSPVLINSPMKVMSAVDAFRLIQAKYVELTSGNGSVKLLEKNGGFVTQTTITNGTDVVLSWTESSEITPIRGTIEIRYDMVMQFSAQSSPTTTRNVTAIFLIAAIHNAYPMPRLTIADCINRCLELATPVYLGGERKYYLDPKQEEEYAKIIAPEFTMTQATLREQLKTIGGYIHAEPRLMGGNNEVTLADGTKVKQCQIIRFDKLGVSTVAKAPTTYVGNALTYDINQYCTQIDSTAQNIVNALNWAQGVVVSPSNKGIRTPRTETVNIRVQESNANVPTSFPIQSIRKVECGIIEDGLEDTEMYDITPYVYEQTEYDANLTSYKGAYPRSKAYALYYTIGQNNIKGLFYKASTTVSEVFGEYWTFYSIVNILSKVTGETTTDIRAKFEGDYVGRLAFRVSYIPIYQTRVSHGKQYAESGQEYTQVYNQSENIIEARYYGENIKGAAARLGNIEQSRTYIVKDFADIPKVGMCVNVGTEEEPNLYAISGVNAQIFPEHIKFSFALTKDFNRISEYVGISSVKRVYEVSERQAYLRNVLLKEYAIVGKAETPHPGIFRDYSALLGIFKPTDTDVNTVSQAYAWGGTKGMPVGEDATPLTKVALPVISSAFGNAMVFSWNYKDNYSAGEKIEYQNEANVSGWWQQDVPYCDYYGRMEWLNFCLLSRYAEDGEKEASAKNGAARRLPLLYSQVPTTSNIGTNGTPYHIVKDSREIIQMNYELEFKSNIPYLVIGSALASNCPLVNAESKKAYFYPIYDGKIGKFDRTCGKVYDPSDNNALTVVNNGDCISITGGLLGNSYVIENATAWVIATEPTETTIDVDDGSGGKTTQTIYEGGEILIACNDPARFYKEHGSTVYITLVKNL